MNDADQTLPFPARPPLVPTRPFFDSRETLEAFLLARVHDALRALELWLVEYAKYGFEGVEGRLPDARPYRVVRYEGEVALWLFPDDAARVAWDACETRRPFLSRDLRYLYAARVRGAALGRESREALISVGTDVDAEGGVIVRRCVRFGETVRIRPADLMDIIEVLGHLIARRETKHAA